MNTKAIHHDVTLSPQRSTIVNWAIKIFALGFFGYLIYVQVFNKEGLEEMQRIFVRQMTPEKLPWLFATVLLMPLNWGLEVAKWTNLLKRFEHLSIIRAYKAVLAGVAFSIFTPNRVGEYGGRILFIKPQNQLRAVIANLVGSFSQLLVILTAGFLGLFYYLYFYWEVDKFMIRGLILLGCVTTALLLYSFFNINTVVPLVKKIPYINRFRKFVKHVRVLKSYGTIELSKTLLFSVLRYLAYSLQYYFLLRFFDIDIPLITGLCSIAMVFLMQTSVPLPPVTGLFSRGAVAMYTWGLYGASEYSALSATFVLWIINLIVPALIGMIILLKINIVKSLGYEKRKRSFQI